MCTECIVTEVLQMTDQLSVQKTSFPILILKILFNKTPSLLAHPTWQNCAAAVFLIFSQEVPVSHLGYTTGYHEYTDFLNLQANVQIVNSGRP